MLTSPEPTCPVHLKFIPSAGTNNTRNEKTLPELVNAIALVIHKPARPAPFVKVATERSVVTRTDRAPSASKFKSSQRFVIQNEYHIFGIVSRR